MIDTQCVHRSEQSIGSCCGEPLHQCICPEVSADWCYVRQPAGAAATPHLDAITGPTHASTMLPVCDRCLLRQAWHWSAGVRPLSRYVIGQKQHRSGWPDAMAAIARYQDPHGILLDDFVEQTFGYERRQESYREPWVGIFHHPPHPPEILEPEYRLPDLLASRPLGESLVELRLAIALSDYLADWLRPRLPCPVAVLRLCSATPPLYWSPVAWEHARPRRLLSVGHYLRNTRILHHVPQIRGVDKVRVLSQLPHVRTWDQRVARHYRDTEPRRSHGWVEGAGYVAPKLYDRWLAESVLITELMDASANTAILDAIARCTPLIVNRHPAAVEYLGPDYPLYYDTPDQVPQLLERAVEAHRYLLRRPRHWLQPREFAAQLIHAIQPHVYGRIIQ